MAKKIATLAIVLSAVLSLTACKENKPNAQTDNPSINQTATQNDKGGIQFSTVPFEYELPQAMKEICDFEKNKNEEYSPCTQIEVELVKIEPAWIEQIVNKAITNDDSPKLVKFKQTLDEFVDEHLTLIGEMKAIAE